MTCLGEIFYPKGLNLLQKSEIKKKSQFLLKSARKSCFAKDQKFSLLFHLLRYRSIIPLSLNRRVGGGGGWVMAASPRN